MTGCVAILSKKASSIAVVVSFISSSRYEHCKTIDGAVMTRRTPNALSPNASWSERRRKALSAVAVRRLIVVAGPRPD